MSRRVVVTGLGVLSPVGLTVPEFWQSLVAGRGGIGPITVFDASQYRSRIAGELKGFDPDPYVDKKEQKWLDPFVIYSVAATRMAVEDSKIDVTGEDPTRLGVIIGSGIGGVHSFEAQHNRLRDGGPSRVSPFFIPTVIVNMAPGYVAIMLGAKGPNYGIVSACSTGAHAIGEGLRSIKRGDCEVMICGGAEAAITPISVAGFGNMRALSTRNDDPAHASRPFDKERDGFVIGEGAGIVVLEELEHARRRGVPVHAEVVGYGLTCDAYHITAPAPQGEGAARTMRMALQDGNLRPDEIDYVNAHGTSTDLNDKLETQAIKTVFGEHARKLAISSTKSMIGHLLGAAGSVEFIATALALKDGVIPPTINYQVPDPDCDLDYVPNTARKQEIRVAVTNSFGFGGHNVTLAVKRFEG
jgi:3-oxoacyl-[acyl-carrier-protein] synthase II